MKLTTELTRLASEIKKANTRIARLEDSKTDFSPAYNTIVKQSTINKEYIFTESKSGHIKIRTDLSRMTKEQIKEIKSVVSSFNEKKSSQVKNVKKALLDAYFTFNKNHPDETITFGDLRWAYEQEKAEEIKKLYGSGTMVEIAKKAQYGDSNFIKSLVNGFALSYIFLACVAAFGCVILFHTLSVPTSVIDPLVFFLASYLPI